MVIIMISIIPKSTIELFIQGRIPEKCKGYPNISCRIIFSTEDQSDRNRYGTNKIYKNQTKRRFYFFSSDSRVKTRIYSFEHKYLSFLQIAMFGMHSEILNVLDNKLAVKITPFLVSNKITVFKELSSTILKV